MSIAMSVIIAFLCGIVGFLLGKRSQKKFAAAKPAVSVPLVDMTSGRTAQEERQFFAHVTHELRTPVTGMVGMADLLLESQLTPEQQTYAESVRASGESLLLLIDDVLDFAAVESGKAPSKPAPFEVEMLLARVVELLAPSAHAKNLEIAAHISNQVPAFLFGDAGRIRQLLLNLAGNAVKYTVSGGVGLRVDVAASGIVFAVQDTGPGIPKEALERLFEDFERGSNTDVPGNGLGLAIVRRLVAALGGELSVESTPNTGSTFAVTLPLPAALGAVKPIPALNGKRILIVTNSVFEGPWISEKLAECGAQPFLISNADVAMKKLAEQSWSSVIIDRTIGDKTLELAHTANRYSIRALVLVTPRERAELNHLRAAGFDGYLVKPVRRRSLVSIASGAIHTVALSPALPSQTKAAEKQQKRVLLAEDDPVNALLAQVHLKKLGYMVERVEDGLKAVEAVKESHTLLKPFSLIVMDLRLPQMSGFDAARQIRGYEKEKNLAPVVIVAVSANTSEADKAEVLEAGMNAFLPKPLDPVALMELPTLATP